MGICASALIVWNGRQMSEECFDVALHRAVQAWFYDNPGPAHIFPSKERFYSDDWIDSLDKDDEVDTESIM